MSPRIRALAIRKLLFVFSLSSYVHLSNQYQDLGARVANTGAQLVQITLKGMSLRLVGPWDGQQ